MIKFDYAEPADLAAAVALLHDWGERAAAVAGGTDLLLSIKKGKARPGLVVGLRQLSDLRRLDAPAGGQAFVGALTTHRHLETLATADPRLQLLRQGARVVGSRQIRNVATIGGNICNAAPSADTAPALLALDAAVLIAGRDGERRVALSEFYRGPGRTVLQPGEVVMGFILPAAPARSGGAYLKHSLRGAMDLAMLGVAAWVELAPDGRTLQNLRLGLATVAPTPMRARAAEEFGRGQVYSEDLANAVASRVASEARPRTSWRSTAEYRRAVLPVLVRDALARAVAQAERRCEG